MLIIRRVLTVLLASVVLCPAFADSGHYRPEYQGLLKNLEKWSGSLNYVIYYQSANVTPDDFMEKSPMEIESAIESSLALPRQRLEYYDRISTSGVFSKIEAKYVLDSSNYRLDTMNLKATGLALRKLRDDFYYPISVPPFAQESKYTGSHGGDLVGVNSSGNEETHPGKGGEFYDQPEKTVTRFWGISHEELLTNGTWERDKDYMKVRGKVDGNDAVAWFDKEGFLVKWQQSSQFGASEFHLEVIYSDWKKHGNLILPGRREVCTSLMTSAKTRVPTFRYYVELLAFDDDDYLTGD